VALVCKAAACLIVFLTASVAFGQDELRNWAGREEYELGQSAFQDPDPMEQIDALMEWEAKYPNSEYAPERLEMMLGVFERINKDAAKAMASSVLESSARKRILSMAKPCES
jgi:outer membrane protein assembly factor BamD (BamD/ComL family)